MSLVQKSSQPDKHRNGVYHVLDAFIRENMLRRFFSLRRPKQEDKETTEELQKENVDPNCQQNQREVSNTAVDIDQIKSSIFTAEPDTTANTELTDVKQAEPNYDLLCNKLDNQTSEEEKHSDQEHTVSALCLKVETSTFSDAESDAKDCDSVKDEVSISDESDRCGSVKEGGVSICEESDRCESSTSADDKDESGIEQDFEPTTDEKQKNSKTDNFTTDLKKELDGSPVDASESRPLALVPINLKSHLKRNERIKTLNRSPKRVSGTMEQINSSCENSPEKSSSFIPSNTNKQQSSRYRTQYSRRPLVITPARPPRRNKAPEMFGDIIIKDRFRARPQFQSPVRKGILKHPNVFKFAAPGVKYAPTQKKSKHISLKGKRISTSSDSGLSDEEGSSGEEQRRMPVKKIFSDQQALRKKIADLNGMLKTMEQQKAELQTVLGIIEDWSEDLRSVDRTNLGVPYIRAVKQTLAKQRVALSNKKSDFNRRITNLKEAEVPFTEEFSHLIQQLRKEVTYVVRDQRKYSARNVENIRQLQGRVIGTCNAILAVYYEG